MERKVRFRGQDYYGNWVYGNLISNKGKPYIVGELFEVNDKSFNLEYWFPVRIKTIGQFTGLKDAEGMDIFDGQIIGDEDEYFLIVVEYSEKEGRFVGISTQKYFLTGEDRRNSQFGLSQKWIDISKRKIVGNIHDNPELLKR